MLFVMHFCIEQHVSKNSFGHTCTFNIWYAVLVMRSSVLGTT